MSRHPILALIAADHLNIELTATGALISALEDGAEGRQWLLKAREVCSEAGYSTEIVDGTDWLLRVYGSAGAREARRR